ncbi:DBIRD complex subunit ZNF326-like isoform X4 [Lethenteron reissneri]|uniref:DBIRD complex subunit ZNF326-like isoform X4 n=1 Tax=Lethenteron reissneri TaxID=7753 RepID=UPI002AB6EF70|nr:DBIRD complex subunit ZNF326-like isoform X4 [Lethenteron reissneri]
MASYRGGGGSYYRGDNSGNWDNDGRRSTRVSDMQDSYEGMHKDSRSDGNYSTAAALLSTMLKMMTSDGSQPAASVSESGYPKDWSSSQEYSYRRSNDSSQLGSGYSAGYSEPYNSQMTRQTTDYNYQPRSGQQHQGQYGRSSSSWQPDYSWQNRGQGYSKGHDFSQGTGWQPSGRGKRGKWVGSSRGRGGMPNAQWKSDGQGYGNQTARAGQGSSNWSSQRSGSQSQTGKLDLRSQPAKQTPVSGAKVPSLVGGVGQKKESIAPKGQVGQQSLPAKAPPTTKAVGTTVLSKNQKRKLKWLPNKINAMVPAQKLPSSGAQPGDGASGAEKGHLGKQPTGEATGVTNAQQSGGAVKRKLTQAPESETTSIFGGLWSTKPKGPRRKGTKKPQYGCSLCQIRTNKAFFIKGHLESVYHQQSLSFLEEEFDKDVSKFLHKLIWRKADFVMRRGNESKCVLGNSDDIFTRTTKRAEREAIVLDEALEMRTAVQCHACNMFVPYTFSMVAQHLESPEHQQNKLVYVTERKTVVVAVAKSILGNDNNSVLLKHFKEGKEPFNNPEYEHLFIFSGHGKKQNPVAVVSEETSKETAAKDDAEVGEAAAELATPQSSEQTPADEAEMQGIAQEDADDDLLKEDELAEAAAGEPELSEGATADGVSGEDVANPPFDHLETETQEADLGEDGVVVDDGEDAVSYGDCAATAPAAEEESFLGSVGQGDAQEGQYVDGEESAASAVKATPVLEEAVSLPAETLPFFEDTMPSDWSQSNASVEMPIVMGGGTAAVVRKSPYGTRKAGRGRGGASKSKAT